ncbi:helix-turn-helix domain-containing protein [Streptomyces spectabilis]|uniref:helix-turn-helix domain-containing protein n=1 Tax=Streptomyces spectabilis TaxID=68270 RepID=UPI0033DF6C83
MVDLPPESSQLVARQSRTARSAAARRAEILTAAVEQFDRDGYQSTSIRQIAELVGISLPSMYRNFPRKEEIAQAIVELQATMLGEAANDMRARGYSSLEALIRITFGLGEDPISRVVLRLATQEDSLRESLRRRPLSELLDLSTRKLLSAVEEFDVRPDANVNAAARSLVYSFCGAYGVGEFLEPAASQPRWIADIWHLMIHGLVPVPRQARYLSLTARLSTEPSDFTIDNAAPDSDRSQPTTRSSEPEVSPLLVTIYLSDEDAHTETQAAVEQLLATAGLDILDRDPPVIGSWFRRIRATLSHATRSQVVRESALIAAHIADTRLVLAQDATITATMMQNVGPVIESLQPTKEAVVRIGAILIVKVDWEVRVLQLTAAQQAILDHQPQLATSPREVIGAISLLTASDS